MSHCQKEVATVRRYWIFACPAGDSIIACIEIPKKDSANMKTNVQKAVLIMIDTLYNKNPDDIISA